MWDTVAAQEIRFFNGSIDEVRISNIARSSDWIKAQYLCMNSSFITYSNEETNKIDNGAAHIFFGYPGINTSNINAANANVTIYGSSASDLFGWSVSDAGDVNGDGYDDVIIGAPGYGSDKGRAYVFYGRATGSWSGIDDADTDADVVLTGEYEGDRFGCSVSGAGDVNYDGWPYRKKITINADKVTGDLLNFPVLINITDSDLRDKARHNGYDIYFTSSDGTTKLDHEIEKFNSHTGELVAWVEIPSLSSSSNTDIYMYYGKDNADDQSNKYGVWDSNYTAVWHMSEDPSGGAPQIKDSTSPSSNGTSAGSMTSSDQVTGKIDGCLDFDGSNDAINFGNPSELQITGAMTLEAWFKADYVLNNNLFAKMGGAGSRGWDLSFDDDPPIAPDGWIMFRYSVDGSSVRSRGYERVNASEWYYAVGVFNPSTYERFYLNGMLESEETTGIPASQNDPAVNVYLARDGGASPSYYNGTIDEVRISNCARSMDWINATYSNINDTSSFYTVYSEEIVGGYGDIIVGAYGYGDNHGRAYIFYGPDFEMNGISYSYIENIEEVELAETASYQDYLTLTVNPTISTNYLIVATSDMGPGGAAQDITYLRLRIDDDDAKIYHEVIRQFEDATDWYHFSAMKYLTLSPGSYDIELEYMTSTGDTGRFRNTRIIAMEMTIPSDQYAERENSYGSTGTPAPERTAIEITFTPSSEGEYLIIATANLWHTSITMSTWGRMYIDGTLYGETLVEQDDTKERMNFGVIKNVTLDTSSHNINITVQNDDDGSDDALLEHLHLVAIRLDTFLEFHYNEAEAQNDGAGAWETLVTNSYTPTSNGDFIVLGTAEWLTNDITDVCGIRLQTAGSTRQESQIENENIADRHMTFQMDKRYLSGSQTDTVDHNIDLATGWSQFARLITLPIGTTYVTLTGEKANDKFGFSVSNAGKVDSDNYYDVIVGAPGGDSAYIFTGDDSMNSSIRAVDANVILSGALGTNFGFSVASCGNINNADGDDVIVGAPGYNTNRGRAFIFYGREHNEIVVANYFDDFVIIYDYTVTEDWEAKINQSVGDMPYSVFVGDANNDGYNDILTADYNDNTVTIYNGTSSGGWEPVGKLYVGDNPRSVYVADTNNDSYNDIVTADYGGNTITIYNGTSSGGWESNYTLSAGNNPYSVFVGDANNDGYNDILVPNYFSDTVSLFNGTSSGGWESITTFNVGESPTYVFVGDANNDGYNDIVSANSVSDNITIYNGTNNGGWDPRLNMSVGGSPLEVFVGDANNDGYNDILTSDRDDNKISIYNGTSNGLWEVKGTLSVGSWPNSVFVGDANNDGYNDILSADITSDTVTIYNGTDGFIWEPKGTLSVGSNPNTVFVCDANNDGYNDIVTCESGSNTVTIIKSRSYADWEMQFLPSGNLPYSVFVGDANNDGYNDILIADNNDDTVSLYNGTSSGGWGTKVTFSVGTGPRSVYVADANNDGYNDILTADTDTNTVTIYNGTSSGGWEAKYTMSVGTMPYSVFVADANNDGYNDILTADYSSNTVTIYNGTSSGGWEPIGTLSVGTMPYSVFVADANNDGYNDILTADYLSDNVTIYNGTSSGGWEPIGTLNVGDGPTDLYVGDANNDGYNDIVTADFDVNTVTILNGTSGGSWEPKCTLDVGTWPYSIFIGDANNDGYNDILTADNNDDTVTLYNGTASGVWEDKTTLSTATLPMDVFVANANNDVMGGSINAADADLILTGESVGDKFGYSVHYAGDIDNDGDPDVIVGAPYHTNGSDTECGAMYVYCGGSDIDSTADYTNYGENAYDHFGWSVSYAGDINSDNYNDTLCGAPYYDDGANTDAGKAYCHSTNVIPEFSDIVIPIFIMITIFGVFRRKQKRKHSKEIQNPSDNGVVNNGYLGGVQNKK